MLVSNTQVAAKVKVMPFGEISLIALGEEGRGRRELRLPCPTGTKIEKGCNALTIGQTKSGKPRINTATATDNEIYLLLSTEGGYTRRGNGWVGSWVGNTATTELIDKGNGADGAAGRIGQWDVVLLRVVGQPQNDWYRIRTSGGGYGTDPQWLHLSPKGVFFFESTDDAREFADSIDVEFPTLPEDPTEVFKDVTR